MVKDLGKVKDTFPNKAVMRQVNYVQEMPINIDYSKFDKLALIQATAQRDNLIPHVQTFNRFVHSMRIDHLKSLLYAFENEISLKPKDAKHAKTKEPFDEESKGNVESVHMECLKRIAGFFAVSLKLHHNLPELFPMKSLKEMWDTAQISLQKGLEQAMNRNELEQRLQTKQGILLFSLCVHDQGLATAQDSLRTVLVKLHDVFRDKILNRTEAILLTCLHSDDSSQSSQFVELICKNDEEFNLYVEKFEFELSEHMDRSN